MSPRARAILWFLALFCLAYDLHLWGGVRDTPRLGIYIMHDAPYESPLAASYLVLGSRMNSVTGITESGKKFAAEQFPEYTANPDQLQHLALPRMLAAQPFRARTAYYGFPLLLVLSFIAHFKRQRRIRSFGVRD